MSAFQPIQLGQLPTMMDGVQDAVTNYVNRRDKQRTDARLEEQQRSEMLHARRKEYSQALQEAHKHIQAGDLQSAQAVLAPFVNGFETADSPLGQPQEQPGAGPAPQPGPPQPQAHGGSAVPDQVDQGRSMRTAPAPFGDDPDAEAMGRAPAPQPVQPPPFGGPGPGANAGPQMGPQMPPPPGMNGPGMGQPPQLEAPPPQNPIMAARAQERATEQRRAQKLLRYADPFTGQQVTLDPAEAEQARRDQGARQGQENARVLHEAFDPLVKTDPFVAEQFPRILATYSGSPVPVDPKQVLSELTAAQRQLGMDRRADEMRGWREGENEKNRGLRREGFDVSKEIGAGHDRARMGAAAMQNPGGIKEDTGNRGDAKSLEGAVKDFYGMADAKTMLKSDRLLNGAITNVSAKGPEAVTSHKDAFMGLARYFRGGTPTDSETQLMMKHLGGIKGAVDQYLADVDTGDFSDITIRNLTAAAQRAHAESQKNIGDFQAALNERFGPGSEFENMGPQVNRHIRAIGRLYGLQVPDLYTDTKGPGVVLGSGTRPTQRPAAPVGGRPKAGRAAPAPAADAETVKKLAKDWDAMK